MTDYQKGESIWIVHQDRVIGATFIADTAWFYGDTAIIQTSVGLVGVNQVHKYHRDAMLSLQENEE